MDPRKYLGMLVLTCAPVWYGWAWALILDPTPAHAEWAFHWLYIALILVCCGGYGLIELRYILSGRFHGGILPLIGALAAGAVGVKAIGICSWPSIQFSGQFWWFALSDVAMYFLFEYFEKRET